VLLDHCVPRRFGGELPGHEVKTAASQGWAALQNGELLRNAAGSFEVFITTDRKLPQQQNASTLPLPVIVVIAVNNRFETLAPLAPEVLRLLERKLERRIYFVDNDGKRQR